MISYRGYRIWSYFYFKVFAQLNSRQSDSAGSGVYQNALQNVGHQNKINGSPWNRVSKYLSFL